jgi:hypothetical protein
MCKLHGWHCSVLFDEAKNSGEHRNVIIRPNPQILRTDPRFRQHGRGFGKNNPRSTHSPAAQMNEVPLVRVSVHARVLAHGRYSNAISQMNFSNLKGRE